MSNSKLNIDAGIDLYIYGRKFLHYDRKEIGDVRVDMGDGKPWVPVKDWMKEGKDMTPDQLRAFAKYFYDRGRESYRVTITAEELKKQSEVRWAFQNGIEEGMNWQKKQMMKGAVEGYVNYYEDSGGILMAEAQVGCPYHNGDKVKIIIVKEDQK